MIKSDQAEYEAAKAETWRTLAEPADLYPIPGYGDHYTLKEFAQMVKCGAITDYDGNGEWATATRSQLGSDVFDPETRRPAWATHVLWFNK